MIGAIAGYLYLWSVYWAFKLIEKKAWVMVISSYYPRGELGLVDTYPLLFYFRLWLGSCWAHQLGLKSRHRQSISFWALPRHSRLGKCYLGKYYKLVLHYNYWSLRCLLLSGLLGGSQVEKPQWQIYLILTLI